MSINLRFPNITGTSEREQLAQMKSYLHQLVEQLQWALNNGSENTYTTSTHQSSASNSTPASLTGKTAFEALKPLIIKSAEIVEAYYEQLNTKFEGRYVAQSDFGTFQQQTEQDIETNATMIEQNFTNAQEILNEVVAVDIDLQSAKTDTDTSFKEISNEVGQLDDRLQGMKSEVDSTIGGIKGDIESINHALIEVNSNIRSGLLYYDENEIPIYGLEIGQKNVIDGVEVFNKYARFTSNRLSFYDQNDTVVAYISDRKIYITHAEVTGTLKLGGYLVDTTKGLTFKWVGRS